MPKCLYCLKQNDDGVDDCRFCHKPLRASTAKPVNMPRRVAPPPLQRPLPPPTPPPGYMQGGQMQGYSPPYTASGGEQSPPQYSMHASPHHPASHYSQQYANPPQLHGQSCPLCNRADGMWERNKLLYDVPVCKKCSNDFANRRALAYIIDSVGWNLFPGFFLGVLSPFLPQSFLLIAASLLSIFGFLFKDGFKGKSLGKSMMGLMVLDNHNQQPIGFGQSVKRNLILYVPIVPLIIAFTLNKGMRMGDGWAGTQVVWTKYLGYGPFSHIAPIEMQGKQPQAHSSRLGRI